MKRLVFLSIGLGLAVCLLAQSSAQKVPAGELARWVDLTGRMLYGEEGKPLGKVVKVQKLSGSCMVWIAGKPESEPLLVCFDAEEAARFQPVFVRPTAAETRLLAAKQKEKEEQARAYLAFEVGLLLQSGHGRPVVRERFWLAKDESSLVKLLKLDPEKAPELPGFMDRAKGESLTSVETGFDGKARLGPVPAGDYLLFNDFESGWSFWAVPVRLNPGENSLILDNKNAGVLRKRLNLGREK